MFSWICQKCGSEVPPSYNECPNCSEVAAPPAEKISSASTRSAAPPPPPPPVATPGKNAASQTFAKPRIAQQPQEPSNRPPKPAGILFGVGGNDFTGEGIASRPIPPQTAQEVHQGFAPPPAYPPFQGHSSPIPPPPPPSKGIPSWLLMLVVALLVGGVVAGAVWLKQRSNQAPVQETVATSESAPTATSAAHRFAKSIELSGFRISEDAKKRATLRVAVTNHNAADLSDIALAVKLKTAEGKQIGTSDIKLSTLEPFSTVDVTVPFKTNLRAYEIPDWQFLRAEFDITSK